MPQVRPTLGPNKEGKKTMKTYKAKNGNTQYMPSLESLEEIISGYNTEGFCLACGGTQGGVEPDARKYICESCKAPKVYGAEELVLMGLCY